MFLERLLQINVAMMAVVASVVLALPQRALAWPAAILVVAIVSVALTDMAGKVRVPQFIANLAVAIVFAVTVPRMFQLDRAAIIAAIGDLLMGAQIPVFFQQKHPRMYMQLIMLGFLQVVVASVMSQGTPFALLLTFYLFTAISALTLLHLHRERLRYQGAALPHEPPPGEARWPLSGRGPAFASLTIGRAVVERELFWRMARMGVAALAVAAAVFFAVPRLGGEAWRGAGGTRIGVVGFSDKIRLGDLGRVIEDRTEVLRLALRRQDTREPYPVEGGVYLRGAVVEGYDQGQWEALAYKGRPNARPFAAARQSKKIDAVDQLIRIEPMQRDEFFCVWPFYGGDERLIYDGGNRRLRRTVSGGRSRDAFVLGCGAFDHGRQLEIIPNQESIDLWHGHDSPLLKMPTSKSGDPVPKLRALAAEWLENAPAGPANIVQRAQTLERRLSDPAAYRYSLQPQSGHLDVDPIEHFVSTTRTGHCEYFAGALALMLRSQGIPARVVLGYRTDEWNEAADCYRVRQLHAHAWVEVFLENGQLPPDVAVRAAQEEWTGAWLRLDATPSAEEIAQNSFWNTPAGKSLDWLDFAWRNYFLEMDRPRQREAIYSPVVEQLRDLGEKVSDPEWWKGLWKDVAAFFGIGASSGTWFSWRAFVAVVLIGVGLLTLAELARRLVRRWLGRAAGGARRPGRRFGAEVEFYRRMEALLARARLVRPPCVTQRAFAAAAGAELAQRAADPQLAKDAVDIAEAFYRVRFALEALDKPQADSVEQGLARLERAIRKR